MNNPIPYKTLAICAGVAFTGILTLYAFYAPNPIISRVPFAVLMSAVPVVPVWLVFRVTRLVRWWWNVVIVYVIAFVLLVVLQGWGRTW